MSQRVRIGVLIGLVGLILAVLGFFALFQLFRRSLAPLPAPTQEAVPMENVVVASHSIRLGTVLRAEDLRLAQVPLDIAPQEALRDIEMATGKFVKTDLTEGEMLLQHHLADPTNVTHDIGFIIDENQVLFAFPANDLMSTLSVLQRGDLIDIFASISQEVPKAPQSEAQLGSITNEEETVTKNFTLDAMQRIAISAMVVDVIQQQQQQGTQLGEGQNNQQQQQQPQNVRVKAYLLTLSPQDALVLKYLIDNGAKFDLVLRNPTADQLFEVNPVTEEFIIDLYQLATMP